MSSSEMAEGFPGDAFTNGRRPPKGQAEDKDLEATVASQVQSFPQSILKFIRDRLLWQAQRIEEAMSSLKVMFATVIPQPAETAASTPANKRRLSVGSIASFDEGEHRDENDTEGNDTSFENLAMKRMLAHAADEKKTLDEVEMDPVMMGDVVVLENMEDKDVSGMLTGACAGISGVFVCQSVLRRS
jgi:hypothetical protein